MPIWRKATDKPPRHNDHLPVRIIGTTYIQMCEYNEGLMAFVSDYGDDLISLTSAEYLDESEPSFSIEDMINCWENAERSSMIHTTSVEDEAAFIDWAMIRKDKIYFFKKTFNIDIKE